jgi:murein DD-endopeptidase MepM/ murein hydrolase activator NlpD
MATPTVAEIVTETSDTLHRGETIGELFSRQGLSGFTLATLSDPAVFDPRRLRAGLVFSFRRRLTDSIPSHISVRTSPEQRIILRRVADGWSAAREPVPWRAELITLEGVIDNSLYEALDQQIADSILDGEERMRVAWDLADIYAWQVDFTRDIRPGDRFRIVAERLLSTEGQVRLGRVLAGDLTVAGTTYSAFHFAAAGGKGGYFDDRGLSLRRSFLVAPLEFRRISSRISSARRHPILGTIRRHEGTDYAADPGTPVLAAGDGVVARKEWSGSYGNLVEIRHANGIVTRYGHLREFARGLATGEQVQQGQVLGYVGSTGLATGPHLHYEFRVNGIARDPRTIDVGAGEPIPAEQRPAFEVERARLVAVLGRYAGPAVAAVAQ